jgi:hypothetical protein
MDLVYGRVGSGLPRDETGLDSREFVRHQRLDGAPDGDGDLPEPIFANEICGTSLKAGDGLLFVGISRDADDWYGGVIFARGLEGLQTVEVRKAMVEEDDVERVAFDGVQIIGKAGDKGDLRVNAGSVKCMTDELGVTGIILEVQYTYRAHDRN